MPEAERPVVARALAKDPAQRFPSCLAFIGALYKARTPVKVRNPKREPALVGPWTMGRDKKNRGGKVRMALPKGLGAMARDGDQWTIEVDPGRFRR